MNTNKAKLTGMHKFCRHFKYMYSGSIPPRQLTCISRYPKRRTLLCRTGDTGQHVSLSQRLQSIWICMYTCMCRFSQLRIELYYTSTNILYCIIQRALKDSLVQKMRKTRIPSILVDEIKRVLRFYDLKHMNNMVSILGLRF